MFSSWSFLVIVTDIISSELLTPDQSEHNINCVNQSEHSMLTHLSRVQLRSALDCCSSGLQWISGSWASSGQWPMVRRRPTGQGAPPGESLTVWPGALSSSLLWRRHQWRWTCYAPRSQLGAPTISTWSDRGSWLEVLPHPAWTNERWVFNVSTNHKSSYLDTTQL